MKNLILFGFLAFALTGLLTPSVVSDSFADTENEGRDQGKKTANGCNDTNPGKAKNQNPNCTSTVTSVDCTYDKDGTITAEELASAVNITTSVAQNLIDNVEVVVGDNNTDVIDTTSELNGLNNVLVDTGLPTCF